MVQPEEEQQAEVKISDLRTPAEQLARNLARIMPRAEGHLLSGIALDTIATALAAERQKGIQIGRRTPPQSKA